MTRPPHRLIHASAGTGKTYQLSGRYLELLLAGVEPRAILATTFTRKAAGEIQDRVLERLARAARSAEERARLGAQIGREPGAAEVEALLARLVRSLAQMRVRTLDAFFVHLARLFALELGLPSEWSIADDVEEQWLAREAVARTLAGTRTEELLVLLRGLQRAEGARGVERTLLAEVEQGRNAFLESTPEAWRCIQPPAAPDPRDLAAARTRIADAALPLTQKRTPRKSWEASRTKLLAAVEAGDWRALIDLTLVKRVLRGERQFDGVPIGTEWSEPLRVLLQQAAHVLLPEVVAYNAAAYAWLERFERYFDALKAEERTYRFEDLPKALHPRDESRLGALESLWYRLDGRIDHLLLDEFQDTAPVQWRILAHLADEILADGTGRRSFFCVGDLKQSIYGFREAEPRLLEGLRTRYPVLVPEPLHVSFRSSQVVLDTVDRVFATIADNPAFGREEHRAAAQDFQKGYARHVAHRSDLPGAAQLWEAPPEAEGEEPLVACLRLAARRARALCDQAPDATIGILLRRNVPIARAIFLLRDEGLRASGEGGNPLTDSAAVLHFLSLLHLADHPGDSAAAFHVASSPLGPVVGLSAAGFLRERGPVSEELRGRLAREGYGAFAASFLAAVDAGYGAWDRRRFRQLVDLAHAHDERADLRPGRFVERVRLTRVEDPAATQVQVMTVHAAKGLEFDAVILPELDGAFLPQRSEILLARPDPAGLITAVSRAPAEEICLLEDGLAELWSARERRDLREALCLLYVAMTRARHRLEMIVQARRSADPGHGFAGVLRAALGAGAPGPEGLLWAHPDSTDPWFRPRGARAAVVVRSVPRPRPFRAPAHPPLAARSPSAREGDGRAPAATLLRAPRAPARLTGDLVHAWLAHVEWLEDFAATDEELLGLGRRLTADERLLRAALAELRGFLAQPATRAALSLGGAPRAERTVWRERPFASVLDEPDGTRALWSGSFDRVVLHGRPGAWTRAEILDFKTDDVEPASLAEKTAHYRPQLEAYRRVLSAQTALAPGAITARLLFLRQDALIEV